MQSKAASVDASIAEAPAERRPAHEWLRNVCLRVFPAAEDGIAYGTSAFNDDGTVRVPCASRKDDLAPNRVGPDVIERRRVRPGGVERGEGLLHWRKSDAIDLAQVESRLIEAGDAGRSDC